MARRRKSAPIATPDVSAAVAELQHTDSDGALRRLLPLLVVAVAAALVRGLCLTSMWETLPHTHETIEGFDAHTYRLWAEKVAAGDWLGRSQGAFYYAPLYPTILGLVLGLFGGSTVVVALVLNAACGVLGAVACAGTAMRRFGPAAGWIAGLAFALSGTQVAWEGVPVGDAMLGSLTMLALWLMPIDRSGRWRWLACGCVCALLVAGRASFVLPVFCVAAWLAWPARHERSVVGSAVAYVLPVLLVAGGLAIRNGLIGGIWAITTNGPVNFYIGNVPGAPGVFATPDDFEATRARINKLPAGERGDAWKRELHAAASEDPAAVLAGLARKTLLMFSSWDAADNASYYFLRRHVAPLQWTLGPLVVVTAGWAGLAVLWSQRRQHAPLLIFAAAFAASIILVFVAGRYKLPLTGILCIIAGGGASALWTATPAARKDLVRRAALALPAAAVIAWPRPQPPDAYRELLRPNEYLYATSALLRAGRLDAAMRLGDTGRALFPEVARLHDLPARAAAEAGDWEDVARRAREAASRGRLSPTMRSLMAEATRRLSSGENDLPKEDP